MISWRTQPSFRGLPFQKVTKRTFRPKICFALSHFTAEPRQGVCSNPTSPFFLDVLLTSAQKEGIPNCANGNWIKTDDLLNTICTIPLSDLAPKMINKEFGNISFVAWSGVLIYLFSALSRTEDLSLISCSQARLTDTDENPRFIL